MPIDESPAARDNWRIGQFCRRLAECPESCRPSGDERYASGSTVPLDAALLPEAQKLVADFRKNMLKLAENRLTAPPPEEA